jgi:class 3 adenylate cyclase
LAPHRRFTRGRDRAVGGHIFLHKDTGFPILVSDETYQALNEVPDVGTRSLTAVQIKGKRDRVTVYALSD